MLQYFKGKIDIGTGNGGILSQLKLQNELKLTDESWIGYLKNKGNEEFQKCMEDLTDMQNHVLPYLQSFCSLEEKSVQEKQERQVAEKQDSRVEASRAANVTKGDNDKAVKKVVSSMQTEKNKATTKAKKPSIHERLEINKRKIQEKQGKDDPERGADRDERTVEIYRKALGSVLDIAKVLTVTNEDVLPAYLQRVSDFEDCLLATCTKANQCDAIVTRNKKDFLSFWITLLSPEELLNIYS